MYRTERDDVRRGMEEEEEIECCFAIPRVMLHFPPFLLIPSERDENLYYRSRFALGHSRDHVLYEDLDRGIAKRCLSGAQWDGFDHCDDAV